ncbi:AI-2E family transporter [Cohaesibacter gelatinilyticus]|uniref:Predicted PurR-regulated permease PerM n=1 Tax=Cohaesibacter gelatinilyticus TaxID=372072 RepID=A0A285NGK6_9HYPH|nr:AI-2E family transporter [Cohaesibacter gelatinilyticus]SNZ08033.1 Predicted PurR-regulated permease PerM [Cohaesibacter gelatinilyticus]
MTLQKQFTFWFIALLALCLCLFLLRGILLPFVAGMALAYLLDPIADAFERLGMSRMLSTVTILILFLLIFMLAIVIIVPVLAHQMSGFAENLPGYIAKLQDFVSRQGASILPRFLNELDAAAVQANIKDLVSQGASWIGALIQSIWNGGQALLDIVALMVITPVVAFYLLYDWDRMIAKIDGWLPRDSQMTVRRLAAEIDNSVSGFVRGQIMVGLILGIFYAVSLSLLGLNFGLLIGLGAGVISFIPYVGATLGLVVSGGVAVVQFWPDMLPIGIALGIFAVGQFVEGNILQPRLVGERVGLHPVWLMFALLAFGSLYGFVGMLIAVPAAAAIGVIVRYVLEQYLQSPIYQGRSGLLIASSAQDEAQEN